MDAGAQDAPTDAQWMPECTTAIDGGALGAPEAIATGRPEPSYVGVSSDGPVWSEANYYDSAGTTRRTVAVAWIPAGGGTPQLALVDDLCEFDVREFHVHNDYFAWALWPQKTYCGGSSLLEWCRIDGGEHLYGGAMLPFALGDSHIYWPDFPCALWRAPLDYEAGAVPTERESDACGATGIDNGTIYLMHMHADTSVRYSIERISHWGDAPHVLADNVPGPTSHMGFQADDGAVFWQVDKTSRIYELPAGSSTPRILVDDPDGVWGFTVDHDYVYWASGEGWKAAQGTVKRIRRCGGTPEVIGQGQRWSAKYRDPVGISVGADALYWVTGDGNIMRIRKLDAPDAGVDATGDASLNASPDAGFDASIDAGVE